jgi:hypothetical protein
MMSLFGGPPGESDEELCALAALDKRCLHRARGTEERPSGASSTPADSAEGLKRVLNVN